MLTGSKKWTCTSEYWRTKKSQHLSLSLLSMTTTPRSLQLENEGICWREKARKMCRHRLALLKIRSFGDGLILADLEPHVLGNVFHPAFHSKECPGICCSIYSNKLVTNPKRFAFGGLCQKSLACTCALHPPNQHFNLFLCNVKSGPQALPQCILFPLQIRFLRVDGSIYFALIKQTHSKNVHCTSLPIPLPLPTSMCIPIPLPLPTSMCTS